MGRHYSQARRLDTLPSPASYSDIRQLVTPAFLRLKWLQPCRPFPRVHVVRRALCTASLSFLNDGDWLLELESDSILEKERARTVCRRYKTYALLRFPIKA